MTPKEKAEELFKKYEDCHPKNYDKTGRNFFTDRIKTSALIAVDECIESTKQLIHHYTKGSDERYVDIYLSMSLSVTYWQAVKQEIENI